MYLRISHISKTFGKEQVLQDLSFTLEAHRMLSILGRSGSGKTTLLKIIAGLETPNSGMVKLDGQTMNEVPAHLRNFVYLYQEPLLFPHLNAFENVAFGLRLRKLPGAEILQKTTEMLGSLELSDQAEKMPHQLSGGQRQRVAFGRALIVNPRVLLLDEPFGALDTETRQTMQQLLKQMVAASQITTLFVTHDIKEAILMGDEIALMQDGILKKYESKTDFVCDAQTGVQEEVAFWAALGIGN